MTNEVTAVDAPTPRVAQPQQSVGAVTWRCFHCAECFEDRRAAAEHFGTALSHQPACEIDIAEYRAMEARMEAYNEEDSELHRAIRRLEREHRTALMRDEEKGYARGLKDAHAPEQDGGAVPIYQIGIVFSADGDMTWCDSDEDEYAAHPNAPRRIVYAVPRPAAAKS